MLWLFYPIILSHVEGGLVGIWKILSQDLFWSAITRKRWPSASRARAAASGAAAGKNPQRLSLLISCYIVTRSWTEEKSHQAGEACIRKAMSFLQPLGATGAGGHDCAKPLRHQGEEAHEERTWSRWAVILRSELMTTPSALMELTRMAPLIIREAGGRKQ